MPEMNSEPEKAEIKVHDEKGYVLVRPPRGVNFWDVLMAVGRLIMLEGFVGQNDLWVFRDGAVDITLDDLRVLKEFGVRHYPGGAARRKTAVVVETHFQRALVESYLAAADPHPRKIRVFMDFDAAEAWVTDP